jgi:hypothetical protein
MKLIVEQKIKKLKISGEFIGSIPEEFAQLPENAVIRNLKTRDLFKKKNKRWIKIK